MAITGNVLMSLTTVKFRRNATSNLLNKCHTLMPLDLTLYIQTLFLSYGYDNFLRIYSRGERYPSALGG